ncbi:hypothetical protein TNCV_4794411 [Trichonephila clavipes]|nr:hypothetical protein TNCV_4794411 [Trichonephila clavipes]
MSIHSRSSPQKEIEKCGKSLDGSPTSSPTTTEPIVFEFSPSNCSETEKHTAWDLLQHPPYSTTEAPTDYHVNRSLKKWQMNKIYYDLDELLLMSKRGSPLRIMSTSLMESTVCQSKGNQ